MDDGYAQDDLFVQCENITLNWNKWVHEMVIIGTGPKYPCVASAACIWGTGYLA